MKRRYEKLGAGTALAGGIVAAGVFLGDHSEVVEGKAVLAPHTTTIEVQAPTLAPATTEAENPDQSPKNRVRRCVFAAGRAAILDLMQTPGVATEQHDGKTFYTHGSGHSASVDTASSPGKAILDYEISLMPEEGNSYAARGLITIALTGSGSVEDSLSATSPDDLGSGYELDDGRTAVYELDPVSGPHGSNVKDVFTQQQADIACDVADGFIDKIQ